MRNQHRLSIQSQKNRRHFRRVRWTIENQRITKINLLKHRNWKGKDGEQVIVRIIENQSTRVDAVSGASMSSVAIMNAVENAVQKAKANTKGK